MQEQIENSSPAVAMAHPLIPQADQPAPSIGLHNAFTRGRARRL
jgi:hypothetical protein